MTEWITLGRFRDLCFELAAQASITHPEIIPLFETRFPNVLESCLETPRQTFDGQLLYPRLEDQASALFYLLIKSHPFFNGNKRIAAATLLVFLYLNGKWLTAGQMELYELALRVASSEAREKDRVMSEIKEFLSAHLV
jgi:death on curing protein